MRMFLAVVSMLLAAPAARAQDSWASRTPMDVGREQHASASVSGYLYVFGGSTRAQDDDPRPPNPPLVYDHRMDRYDPTTDRWSQMAAITSYYGSSPVGWRDAAGVAYNGAIYQIGGTVRIVGNFFSDSSTWKYDVAANTWTQLADLPGRTAYARAVATPDRIYVIAHDSYAPDRLRTLELNPATGSWTEKAGLDQSVSGFDIGLVNGKIYVVGGEDRATWEWSAATHEYDPAGDSWTQKADMPAGNAYAATAVAKMKLFVLGGYAGIYDATWEYNAVEDRWTDGRSPLPGGRYYGSAAVVSHGGYPRIHVTGGNDDRPCRLQNYEYTPPTYPRPDSPINPFMRQPGGSPLQEGAWIGDTLEIGADLSDPNGNQVSLEVECVPAAAPYTGIPTVTSPFGPSGPAVVVVPGLTEGAWKWRSRARNSNDEVDAADWREFGTDAPDANVDLTRPSIPTGISPANQDVMLRTRRGSVEFAWNPSTDNCPLPITYEVEVSMDPEFMTGVTAGSTIGETTTRLNLQSSRYTYYWRVRSMDGLGHYSESWSASLSFRVTFDDGINHAEGDAARVCGFSVASRGSWIAYPLILLLAAFRRHRK